MHRKDGPSDGRAVPEKFVVFVVATLSRAQVIKALHEFDGFDHLTILNPGSFLHRSRRGGP